jgi:hypothetical protein
MKKLLLPVLATLLYVLPVSAQSDTSIVDDYKGGFLHFTGGLLVNNSHNLRGTLNTGVPFPLGGRFFQFQNINAGLSLGLGSMTIFDNGAMLGARAEYGFIASQSNDVAKVRLNGVTAQFQLGKILYNNRRMFAYPFLGMGFYRYFVSLENISPSSVIDFVSLNPILPKGKQTYTANYPIFELGIGGKRFFSRNATVGVEAGIYFSASTAANSSLYYKGRIIHEKEAPGLNGGFIRITYDLVRFGKKAYIDTTRRIISPKSEPAPVKQTEKKAAAKEDGKKPSGKPEAKPEEKKKTESKPGKAPAKKKPSKKPVKSVNPNDQLFDFGNKPAIQDTVKKTPQDTTNTTKP